MIENHHTVRPYDKYTHRDFIEKLIKPVLNKMYQNDSLLFSYRASERCITFRFAHYLQNEVARNNDLSEYYVDCDYNIRSERNPMTGRPEYSRGKEMEVNGRRSGRFIDVIVHKRAHNYPENFSDLIAFELKTGWCRNKRGMQTDKEKLVRLTSEYGYKYGFHLIFGTTKEEVEIAIYSEGREMKSPSRLYENN